MMKQRHGRSRRLRKKLHLEEFQQLGFEFTATLAKPLSAEEDDALIDRFLEEVVDARNLVLTGWSSGGFISRPGGSATTADRTAVADWLEANPALTGIQLSELIDAWYGPWDTLDGKTVERVPAA